ALFAAAIAGALVARKLKLPIFLGYIVFGVLVGVSVGQYLDQSFISLLSQIGVTLLLFTLGIEFSGTKVQRSFSRIFWASLVQILVTMLLFFFFFLFLGFSYLPSVFLSVATALSSTAVVVKLLSERGEIETEHGQVLTGWLLLQDIAVLPLMILLPALMTLESSLGMSIGSMALTVGASVAKSVFVVLFIFIFGKRVLPKLLDTVSGLASREVFLLVVVSIVFLTAILTYVAGLSAAIGAFIAGMMLADTSQNHAIFSEIRPLRDLFTTVFFVSLGMQLPFAGVLVHAAHLFLLIPSVIVLKLVLSYGLCRFLGFHKKTSFIVGLGLSQMSEFGFIIASEGVRGGVLSGSDSVLLTTLTFGTIVFSSPLLAGSSRLYYFLSKKLTSMIPTMFSQKNDEEMADAGLPLRDHVVILGYGRVGKYIGRSLEMAHIPFVVVEYNHAIVKQLREKGITVVYGDPAEKDVLDYAQVDLARIVVIAIPDRHTQEMVISLSQTLNKGVNIICRTHHEEDQARLKSLGVQTVIQPEFEGALTIVSKLLNEFGVSPEEITGKIIRLKIEHGLG
ncbi:cation:proton antiporter, partial [Candidatus Gottesmanbacteria bacterium]|nr:cation:proton antiporter [Candidatus Gottesmanbacteria bacterium]